MKVNHLYNKRADYETLFCGVQPQPRNIYTLGSVPPGPFITIVGSRRPTAYGRRITEKIVSQLAQFNCTIVSGLAIGIDSIAHRTAIEVGLPTVAIIPSSIDMIYPARHRALAKDIIKQNGAVMSEHSGVFYPQKYDFVARNRLLAGIADILIVTEAKIQSGTSHTVRFALELGKTIGAVPGPVDAPLSTGTNALIKDGAHLIESGQDIADILSLSMREIAHESFGSNERSILSALQGGPLNIDQLARCTNFTDDVLCAMVLKLESQKIIKRDQNGVYYRTS